ncbi:hypothetical protein CC2G_005016 [Coprinopsis cinerea AmutBmut pab1-1]|nr:hypothetical protein CC2G_005016 [Coprinopsis cinerea AmutBmut pab1-1]
MISKNALTVAAVLSGLVALARGAPQPWPGFPNPGYLPGPAGFNITSVGIVGTGCPPGSTYYELHPERNALTVVFSEHYVEIGPPGSGIPASPKRNCRLSMGVYIPQGFTFSVASVDYRGYYGLDDRVTASQTFEYFFQGQLVQVPPRKDFVGPLNWRGYTYRDTIDPWDRAQSPCGGGSVLRVQNDLRVSNAMNPGGRGYVGTDSMVSTTGFGQGWDTE